MKQNNPIIRIVFCFALINLILISCKKDEDPEYNYFVSKEFSGAYSAASINTMFDIITGYYPEVHELKSFATMGINVSKVTYNTTVDGERILASGLVSVPSVAGEYPVLSFQNGTNTVNANAPSENPGDLLYQMVEFISSMGFIVVIPDYPGFGESAQIPHPYLITEPTVGSVVDMLYAVKEAGGSEFPGIRVKNEYYLLGYSQGGWATLNLHKALELDYNHDFNLAGSVCGAGPYNLYSMFQGMVNSTEYPMPSYLGYIINSYSEYNQFTNQVSDILNTSYSDDLSQLYNGTLSLSQINSNLTTSISGLFKADFLAGFTTSSAYSSVRNALNKNSVTAWNTSKSLLLVHGESDTHVSVTTTETMYDAMIDAGTSVSVCRKQIFPGLDHGDGLVPAMTEGLLFILNLRDQ